MTARQLTLDGRSVPYPTPRVRELTDRQHDLLRLIRHGAPLAFRTGEARLFYADPGNALRRLAERGLIEKVARGRWCLVVVEEEPW